MIEIRLEIEPKNKTPLDCVNLIVLALESLVENQDIEHYTVATVARCYPEIPPIMGTILCETIHAGGKDVKP